VRALVAVAVLEVLAMNGDGGLAGFRQRFEATPEVQALAVETAYSYPVPADAGTVLVYAYRLRGRPPQAPKVSAPRCRLVAEYPAGRVLRVEELTPAALAVPLQPDGTLGDFHMPDAYRRLPYDEFLRKQAEYDRVYEAALSAYLAGRPVAPEAAVRVLDELPVFAKGPLVPVLKAASPAFFRYLEAARPKPK
jgi:hypothetical protein